LVCCNVEDLNFGMQNLRPSNIKVIFHRPSCGSPTAVASGFIAGTAPVTTIPEKKWKSRSRLMASKNGNAVGLTSILDRRRFVLLATDVLDYKTVAGGGPDDGRRRILLRRRRRRRGAAFRRRRRRVRFDSIAKCRRPGRREVLVEVAAVRAGAAERAEGVAGGVAVRREHLPGRRQSAVGRRCQSRRRGRGESAGTLFTLIMLVVVGVMKSAGVRLHVIVFTRRC